MTGAWARSVSRQSQCRALWLGQLVPRVQGDEGGRVRGRKSGMRAGDEHAHTGRHAVEGPAVTLQAGCEWRAAGRAGERAGAGSAGVLVRRRRPVRSAYQGLAKRWLAVVRDCEPESRGSWARGVAGLFDMCERRAAARSLAKSATRPQALAAAASLLPLCCLCCLCCRCFCFASASALPLPLRPPLQTRAALPPSLPALSSDDLSPALPPRPPPGHDSTDPRALRPTQSTRALQAQPAAAKRRRPPTYCR